MPDRSAPNNDLPPRLKPKRSDLHEVRERPQKDSTLPPGHARTRYAGTARPKR